MQDLRLAVRTLRVWLPRIARRAWIPPTCLGRCVRRGRFHPTVSEMLMRFLARGPVQTVLALGVTTSTLIAAHAGVRADLPLRHDRFVRVNGIQLHYVDWGGSGPPVLMLTGLGEPVEDFDAFASRFTDQWRVLGVERRGQGQSDKPSAGYDTKTLAEDLRLFLDALHIARVTLVGHSIAGAEMTMFAGVHPERVARLVYLDAAYDYERAEELAVVAGSPFPPPSDPSIKAIADGANHIHPDYDAVRCPALAFFVLLDQPYVTAQMTAEARRLNEAEFHILEGPYKREQVALFRSHVKHARVVELHNITHTFFNDPKRRDEVVRQIRDFLSGQ